MLTTDLQNYYSPILVLENIGISSQGKKYFSGTYWKIQENQVWAIVGGNDSGKEVLIGGLCGTLPVCEGKITSPKIERVSFSDQSALLGRENLYYQARWNSISSSEGITVGEYLSYRKVHRINPFEVIDNIKTSSAVVKHADDAAFNRQRKKIITMLELSDLIDETMLMLSNGEMRKTILASAILRMPGILVLEEPLSGLDAHFREKLTEYIRSIHRMGINMIFTFSRYSELPDFITHVLEVRDGSVISKGPLEQFKNMDPGENYSDDYKPVDMVSGKAVDPFGICRVAGLPSTDSSGEELARFNDVHIRFGAKTIIHRFNWRICRGEHWGLTGPNGSGKSTISNLLSGDIPQAYAQEIFLFGKAMGAGRSIWELRRRLGFFSSELLYYHPLQFTVLETVGSGLFDTIGLFRLPDSEQMDEIEKLINVFELGHLKERTLGSITIEERRLCLIARALVKNPELLILDEPCQGLDQEHRSLVWNVIRDNWKHDHGASVYISHDLNNLPDWINRRLFYDEETGNFHSFKI